MAATLQRLGSKERRRENHAEHCNVAVRRTFRQRQACNLPVRRGMDRGSYVAVGAYIEYDDISVHLSEISMSEQIDTGFSDAQREAIAQELSKVLADSYAVYQKTHGYHWNVRGPEFFSLHGLFQQQYTEIWTALDDIAERIRALGVLAPQSSSAFGNLTSISEGNPDKSAQDMLAELVRDHGTVIKTARAALQVAEEAGDEASVDLMTQRLAAHEKSAWMLRSSIAR